MQKVYVLTLTLALVTTVTCQADAVAISTSFGAGADAEIANDEVALDPVTGQPNPANQAYADDARGLLNQAGVRMQIDALFLTIIRHRATVLRFDLSGVTGDFSEAYLELHSLAQGRAVDVFALNDSAEAGFETWDEGSITYNTAPGFQAIDPLPTSYVAIDSAKVTSIGGWAIPGPNSGGEAATNVAASRTTPTEGVEPGRVYDANILPAFNANLSAAIASDTNNLLTLLITRSGASDPTYTGNNGNLVFLTKEGLAADQVAESPVGYTLAPSLVLPHATLLEPGNLIGDYNSDNVVDAADYTVWRNNVGGTALANRDSGLTGPIGDAAYAAWKAHFGQTAGGSGFAAASAVPEPSAGFLAAIVSAIGLLLGRPGRWTAARREER